MVLESTAKFSQKMIECSLIDKGAAKPFKPGDRRNALPQWDKDRCIRCGVCYMYCPDGAVYREETGFFDVDKDKCKGCGICHRECWFGVINMALEE